MIIEPSAASGAPGVPAASAAWAASDASSSAVDPADAVGTSRGTRILGYVVATLLGALFGAIGTVVHQIDLSVFGLFDLPIGLVIALVAIALLLTGLRMIAPSRLVAALAAAALVGMVVLLTLESPGGSVLVPAGTTGLVWLFGSTLIAVVVIAWPRLAVSRSRRPDAVDLTR